MDSKDILGGSIFWILFITIAIGSTIWLGIWAFINESIKGAIISFLFSIMILTGIILSKFEIFNKGTWTTNSVSFTIFFLIWLYIAGSTKSVLSITQNSLFSTIASELPLKLEFLANSFMIPIAEELFWMVGLPFVVNSLMKLLGKKIPIFSNVFVRLTAITIVTGITFAVFHVGKMFMVFLISAFIFRAIMVWAIIGDQELDWIKWLHFTLAGSLGAHIGNNWGNYGFMNGITVLNSAPEISIIIYGLLGIIFLTALDWTIKNTLGKVVNYG